MPFFGHFCLSAFVGKCNNLSEKTDKLSLYNPVMMLKIKAVTVSALVATILSALFLMIMPDESAIRILTFAILGVFALIVPGVILQKQGRG